MRNVVAVYEFEEVVNSCDIIRKDYREFLQGIHTGSVDLILTDPPYAISRETGFAKVRNGVKRFAVSIQKPLALFTDIVQKYGYEGDLICDDPFIGSGKTAEVALRGDRRFTGCDIE